MQFFIHFPRRSPECEKKSEFTPPPNVTIMLFLREKKCRFISEDPDRDATDSGDGVCNMKDPEVVSSAQPVHSFQCF